MEQPLYNQTGESVGTVELSEKIFGAVFNADLVHQVVTSLAANLRQNIAHTKDRSEVRGGGRKPWRQKGTGRARHASIRSPIWKGGGVAFGPRKERNFSAKINKNMGKAALSMVLSSKVKDNELFVLDSLTLSAPKTKEMVALIKNFFAKALLVARTKTPSALIVLPAGAPEIVRSTNNIPRVEVLRAGDLNARVVLQKNCVLMLKDSVPVIEGRFGKKK